MPNSLLLVAYPDGNAVKTRFVYAGYVEQVASLFYANG
jgi:hypothetical protein